MSMPAVTRLVGFVLVVLGLASYVGTGRTSVTALIPALFGALFLVLAFVARTPAARKHVMHAAVGLALVGLLGTASRLAPALSAGDLTRPAVLAQIAMVIVLVGYIALGVKSFVDARRARQ